MNRAPTEKEIQKAILEYLKYRRIFHYRNNSGAFKRDDHFYTFGAKGSPDIICVIKGQYVGIEVKGPKGVLSPGQKEFKKNLEAAGGKYIVARSIDDMVDI